MKKSSFLKITSLLLALLLAAGCSIRLDAPAATAAPTAPGSTPAAESTAEPAPEAEPGLSETEQRTRVLVSYENLAQDFQSDDGAKQLFTFSCSTPRVIIPERPESEQAINAALTAMKDELLRGYEYESGEVYGLEPMLQRARDDYAGGFFDFSVPYALSRDATLMRGDAAIVSFAFDGYTNSGGAHGYSSRSGATFDTETGARLTLADLAADESALRELCLNQIIQQAATMDQNMLYEGYRDTLPELLENDLWYFSNSGLVFVANPYHIAPYAAGRIEFTVSYKLLKELLHTRYQQPARDEVQGGVIAFSESELGSEAGAILETVLNDGGERVLLRAVNCVYNVTVSDATYLDYSGKFRAGTQHLFASRLDDGETLRVTTYIPDVLPNLMVTWRLPDGTEQTYLISQSGEDGSILLIDPQTLDMQPGDISSQLPYHWDMDADDMPETIDLGPSTLENSGSGAMELSVLQNGARYAVQLKSASDYSLWLADPIGSGQYYLILSWSLDGGGSETRVWRIAAGLKPVQFTDGKETKSAYAGRVSGIGESAIYFDKRVDVLGSHWARQSLEAGPDYTLVPVTSDWWDFGEDEPTLQTTKDIPVTLAGGQSAKLAAGTTLRLTGSDGSSKASFVTAEGVEGSFAIEWSAKNNCWQINGENERSLFDGISYDG